MVILNNSGGIDVSEATATSEDVKAGKTFFAGEDEMAVGTLATKTPNTDPITTEDRTYPAGYYDQFIVRKPTQKSIAGGTLSAGASVKVEPGYYAEEKTLTGWIPGKTQGAQTIYPTKDSQKIPAGTYLTGDATINGISINNLTPGNIKKDVTVTISNGNGSIESVKGTYEAQAASPTFGNTPEVKETSANNYVEFTGLTRNATYIVIASVTGKGTGSTSWSSNRNSAEGWSSIGGDNDLSWNSDGEQKTFTKMWKFVASSYTSFRIGITSNNSFYNYALSAICLKV